MTTSSSHAVYQTQGISLRVDTWIRPVLVANRVEWRLALDGSSEKPPPSLRCVA